MSGPAADSWNSGHAYEQYVGRWSRKVAIEFLRWLTPSPGLAWADVGCGTGALTSTILTMWEPSSIVGVDSSEGFVAQARRAIADSRVHFEIGDATRLPLDAADRDVTVSGLVLNFVRDHEAMAREMARVTRPGGSVGLIAGEISREDALWPVPALVPQLGWALGRRPVPARATRRRERDDGDDGVY